MDAIKKKYNVLKRKYNLPDYLKLNKEFEIYGLESDSFFLRNIRLRITEKFDFFRAEFEAFNDPGSSMSAAYEMKEMDDDVKRLLFEVYRKFSLISRASFILIVEDDDKGNSIFIKEAYKIWIATKPDLLRITNCMKTCWIKEKPEEEELQYLG